MFERVLQIAAVLAPAALGFALQASSRSRRVTKIRTYSTLANELDEHNSASGAELRELVDLYVHRLVAGEHVSLRRRFDPGALVAVVLSVTPAVAVFAWALTVDAWWKWPIIVFAVLWTLLWGGVGLTQLWKPPGEEHRKAD